MTVVVIAIVQQAIVVAAGIVFLVRFGWPWRHPDRNVAWWLWALTFTAILDAAGWGALALGHPPAPWVYLLGFSIIDAVAIWRVWLLRHR
jgi:hypothetical protein